MKNPISFLVCCAVLFLFSCNEKKKSPEDKEVTTISEIEKPLTIAFASCNDQDRPQPLWQSIIQNEPKAFVWGGDNVYADTADLEKMKNDYNKVANNPSYKKLAENVEIIGTWDDHDYGKNDAGNEWEKKNDAKTLLLDFLEYPDTAKVRSRKGVYHSRILEGNGGSVKLILLDTRYFRTALKKGEDPAVRYSAWPKNHSGTILGDEQWKWLENELKDDTTEFTVINTSIQFLSDQHGWEKWGNFPSEVTKFYELIRSAKAKNIVIVSGDRHLAEISVNDNAGLEYPLVDFTTSGLTHTWITSGTEKNPYRVSNVVKQLNFGVLHFNFEEETVTFQIRGEDNFLYEEFTQQY
ncbi:alkaline phosphatase D family protein [Marinirhabdus gelatinilytica]|uniref:Alkaline phosphatase D n=1 Tax=Marinirhabdus gelatinilytica TaxID=1703343 RepID=A0A370QAX4_9FLAO|nr:alkaline phosphatase D family protein [Marinirhabdus gelatinilytica]RDK85525.1 alkaline phosphatase D [Marinirhabdus gelatinilytica]